MVRVFASHGIFSVTPPRLQESAIDLVTVTNTIPRKPETNINRSATSSWPRSSPKHPPQPHGMSISACSGVPRQVQKWRPRHAESGW
jgi:hypothetical protein